MTVTLSLADAHTLVSSVLQAHGASVANAAIVAEVIVAAERDGASSHGLFRLAGYVADLDCGWVDGAAVPVVRDASPGLVAIDGARGYAQVALAAGRGQLIAKARAHGIAAVAIHNSHHFAALWCDVEPFAEAGFVTLAFGNARSRVVPHGGKSKLFGTNPMAFACPRRNGPPMVWDQASSLRAHGEILLAAKHGELLPEGAGYDAAGNPTRDANAVLKGGALGTFGGHKGSAIALMVELMAAAVTGGAFGFEDRSGAFAGAQSSNAGELVLLIDPTRTGGENFLDRTEALFQRLLSDDGARLPGDRRYSNRRAALERGLTIPRAMHESLLALLSRPE